MESFWKHFDADRLQYFDGYFRSMFDPRLKAWFKSIPYGIKVTYPLVLSKKELRTQRRMDYYVKSTINGYCFETCLEFKNKIFIHKDIKSVLFIYSRAIFGRFTCEDHKEEYEEEESEIILTPVTTDSEEEESDFYFNFNQDDEDENIGDTGYLSIKDIDRPRPILK